MSKQQSILKTSGAELLNKILTNPWFIAVWLILGIVLRILLLYQNRPLFIDEGALATEVVQANWIDFFAPLNYQFSPPVFSILEKISTLVFGAKEWALRLVPTLVGIGSLFIFRKWLAEKFTTNLIWFPLAMMAMGWEFVKYSVEAKQYSTDVICSLILIYSAIHYPWKNELKSSLGWALLGGFILWCSMPAVFILASIGIYFFIPHLRNRDFKAFVSFIPVGLFWLLNFGLYFKLILAHDIGKSSLQDFHSAYFFPLLPTSIEEVKQAGFLFYSFIRTLMGGTFMPLLIGTILLLLVLFYHWRQNVRECLLLLIPILLTLVASSLGKYSLISRLTLFFMPFLLFWMANGIRLIYEQKKKWLNLILFPLLLLCIFSQDSWRCFVESYEVENIPVLMSYVHENSEPDEKVYVFHAGSPSFIFYQNHSIRKKAYEVKNYEIGKYDDRPQAIAAQYAEEKIWLLFSHTSAEELNNWLSQFEKDRQLINIKKTKAGAAVLFSPDNH